MIWLLVGYLWLFIHRPFEIWPFLVDLHIERVYMLATLAYWAFGARKTWTRNRVTWGIGLLAGSVILATFLSQYTDFDNVAVQNWFKVLLFYVLVLSSVREERELRILIVAFAVIMGLYELHSLREYACGRGEFRMGVWRMNGVDSSDPNALAASVNYGLAMLLPVLALARRKWHYVALVGAVTLAGLCIFLTGSRSGFLGVVLLAVAGGLLSKYRWYLVMLMVFGTPAVWYSLPERLQNRYLTIVDPSAGPANAQVSADARGIFFMLAVDIWKDNPVCGVGPACFPIVSGTGMQSHTLYGQTISELGTLGAVSLIAMVVCYLLNYLEARRLHRLLPARRDVDFCYRVVAAAGIGVLQLLFFGLAGHNLFRSTWLWYGAFAALALRFLKDHYYHYLQGMHETPAADAARHLESILAEASTV